MVSRLIGKPYESLANNISAEAHNGTGKQYAAKLTATIKNQIDAIVAQEQTAGKSDPAKESALWTTLSGAITDAKNEIEFSSSSGQGVAARPGLLPPAAQQLADQMEMSDQTIAALQEYIKRNGGKMTPALTALLGVTT
jgi:translation initiation factor 2B subunit (eIF-2B alpha/beta/delta family)